MRVIETARSTNLAYLPSAKKVLWAVLTYRYMGSLRQTGRVTSLSRWNLRVQVP